MTSSNSYLRAFTPTLIRFHPANLSTKRTPRPEHNAVERRNTRRRQRLARVSGNS